MMLAGQNNDNNILAKWIANDLTKEELKKFENSSEFLAYNDIKRALVYLKKPVFNIEENFYKQKEFNIKYSKKKSKVISLKTASLSIAAAIAVIFCLKIFILNSVTITTGVGETQIVELPDMSTVQLNSVSSLNYNRTFFTKNRELFLEGQAYFKVAKGQTFTVKLDKGTVKVLGTQFDISTINNILRVNCFEGKVEVQRGGNKAILSKGMGLEIDSNEKLESYNISEKMPSWIYGVQSFHNNSLREVITLLKQHYPLKIDTGDVDLDRHFSGTFPNDNLKQALRSVFNAMNINYTFIDLNKIILKNK